MQRRPTQQPTNQGRTTARRRSSWFTTTQSAARHPQPGRSRIGGVRPQWAPSGGLPRVPQITLLFWVIKILTTGMGEATSDWMAHRYNPYVAGAVGAAAFTVAMVLQFRAGRYVAWRYWFAVAMVSVFGTMAADGLHIKLGVPYPASTTFYAVAVVVLFALWHRTEHTLSIHSITTWRREAFYWATVLATFALGTATGDVTAYTLHWGYFSSGVAFAVVFAIPGLAYRYAKLNGVLAFWFAYVITRPLGASFADWAGVPTSLGGLNLGRGVVSLGLAAIIALLVGYLQASGRDVQLS